MYLIASHLVVSVTLVWGRCWVAAALAALEVWTVVVLQEKVVIVIYTVCYFILELN